METKSESPARNAFSIADAGGNKLSIPMAVIVAGILIAGAILLKGTQSPSVQVNTDDIKSITIAPIGEEDMTLGNQNAEVALVLYEDFQCPFCGAISGLESNTPAIDYLKQIDPNWTPFLSGLNEYIKRGDVLLVYRDWAFLGPESIRSAEAARCAKEQGKFWEYHDFLYSHQNGENKGNFSDVNLKSFAKNLGLNTTSFDQCLDGNKYTKAVMDSREEGTAAGVKGTPKGFILKKGKLVDTIDGAESFTTVKQKIDAVLK